MTQVTRVTLKIKHLSANPRYRPDDIIWTLDQRAPGFESLVEAFVNDTKVNDHSSLKALIEGGPELYHEAMKAKDVDSDDGGPCSYLNLDGPDGNILSLFLNTCELSSHYWQVFKPKLVELGSKSTRSHRSFFDDEELEEVEPFTSEDDEDDSDIECELLRSEDLVLRPKKEREDVGDASSLF